MKKTYIVIAVIVAIFLVGITGSYGYYYTKINEDKILPHIYIDEILVGGLTKVQAKEKLKTQRFYGELELINGDSKFNYSLEELGFSIDIDSSVESAFEVGRNQNLINNIGDFYKHSFFDEEVEFELEYNQPENISEMIIKELEPLINIAPINAKISIDSSINIKKDTKGKKINTEALSDKLDSYIVANDNISFEIPMQEVVSKITYDELSKINGIIGSYRTTYSETQAGRNENIRIAAQRINNILLMPGDEFSYNEATGYKTEKNGYKPATVIVNGEIEEGIGGGVCQVSTTLYNSVLYAGLNISQRRAHSIPTNYVDYGRDAVVSDNAIDFKFTNNHDFPVYIKATTDKNSVTVKIYGDTSKNEKIEIYSKVVDRTEKTIKYVDDPTLPKGQEKVKENGRDEIIAETYKVINGVEKRISKDKYPMKPKVILVGTKEV